MEVVSNSSSVSSIDIKSKIKPDVSYYGTVVYLNHLLTLSEQIKSKNKKNRILIRMFEHLISNPTILIQVPFFRVSIIKKIDDIEAQITARRNTSSIVYTDPIIMLRRSINKRVKHSDKKCAIMNRLNVLSDEIDDYNFWVESIECASIMNTLRNVLEEIKEHPDYVV